MATTQPQLEVSRIPQPPVGTKARERVTPRAVLLALVLAVINDYWIVQLEVVRYSFATYAAPFYNVLFTLLVVTSLNFLARRFAPRWALSRVELLTVYVMLSVTSAVCSHNMMEILVSLMGYAFFFRAQNPVWESQFMRRLPGWLTVHDPMSLRNFYFGDSSLYRPENFVPWLVPVIWWSFFCGVLLFTMLCLNSILRKQWVESERLTFPIVILPLEMTDDSGALFKNKHMWLGFAISASMVLVAGLQCLYPNVPRPPLGRWNLAPLLTQPPWNAMGGVVVGCYFWALGIAFLMPLELSISCWVFHWLIKAELVVSAMMGLNRLTAPGGGFEHSYPYLNSQSYGAYLGFFVMSMWTSRHYLGRVWRTAFHGTKEEDESREAISYRAAIIGAVSGLLFIAMFARQMGMSGWVISIFFLLYLTFAIIAGRIRAELGFPTHDMHIMPPQNLLLTAASTDRLGTNNLVGFAMMFWFNRTYASHPYPHQTESFKIAERSNGVARQFFIAVLIAGAFAMPIGFWMLLHNYYHLGGATSRMEMWALTFGNNCYTDLSSRMLNPVPVNVTAMSFVGVGFAGSMLLGWMRMRYFWFPFHPLAYAIGNSWGVQQLWWPLFLGSTIKFLILRFGGLRKYRAALPFFFGLILGEIAMGSLWTLIGIALGIPTYDFWPGHYNTFG